jgi:hypothetical protein
MYHLYAAHPISMNPFRSAFIEVFCREKDEASSSGDGERGSSTSSENEQLVWVLWKILKGDGTDVSDFFDRISLFHAIFFADASFLSHNHVGF